MRKDILLTGPAILGSIILLKKKNKFKNIKQISKGLKPNLKPNNQYCINNLKDTKITENFNNFVPFTKSNTNLDINHKNNIFLDITEL